MNMPMSVSAHECECAYTYVSAHMWIYVFMWCLTREGILCFLGGGGWVGLCV